ncbi:hypothetical protein CO168_01465 [Candidatus Shapirobacteria bacterium CG_4_9_14_3_um_filter_36_12]|uniref:Glycosyltransferase 2-like domain-containing protein n=5 Tax=Candidatus Shapironibacteriota TaxID=1752721 RepID=A0A1J5I831_9BACT|nr:MAG: hypothetical protein AUK05_01345 [Candidatus Shapirobacteria bacterium CG2_30_35_20]PIV07491.1 MAG: hypothetical protein COS53_01975 [Candidatus Shapirobacteria bacterium CG03_land_8_20_14_0_80_35_14]PIX68173.1 MAG: hypothetical protein COZ41_01060 [Candidatus Shapirobacteria bacterium CG_4_10_14_3_um_filter_35_13]PJA51127.1 MAG: hypothetical protein CO168_01465 [Candidatus Shapirobacteria bacterium CG_4_9_14_3_um_filter_36_12]
MPNNPLLSIIVVSFNTADITISCIKSIYQDKGLKDIPFEIIVIDNASTDDSILKINKFIHSLKIENCKLKINSSNLGFAKANNQGLKIARGQYILLLNSDTIILHSAISQSLNWLSSHPEAHCCTAQLLNKNKTIQASGGFFPTLSNIFTWCLGLDDLPFTNFFIRPFHPHTPKFYTKDNFYTKDHPQDWVTGAFMLFRKSVYDKIGGFDKNWFMYGEEYEYQYRLHLAFPQTQCWYLIGPQIIHLGGASSVTKTDPITREYEGVIAFFTKHKPKYQLPIIKILLKLNSSLRSIINPIYEHL